MPSGGRGLMTCKWQHRPAAPKNSAGGEKRNRRDAGAREASPDFLAGWSFVVLMSMVLDRECLRRKVRNWTVTLEQVAKGHGELRVALAKLIANFEFVQRDLVSILIDRDRAAVHSRVKLRFVPKDRTVATELVDLWKFDNGKIVELVEFVDTAFVNDLMR
jgi:ketosteroid isomerase-like protein